jgi:hypothetical protein
VAPSAPKVNQAINLPHRESLALTEPAIDQYPCTFHTGLNYHTLHKQLAQDYNFFIQDRIGTSVLAIKQVLHSTYRS